MNLKESEKFPGVSKFRLAINGQFGECFAKCYVDTLE
jgi:hypothetical protein